MPPSVRFALTEAPGFSSGTMKLEERQRCEARRGYFPCVNMARIMLGDCRHRVCFDCMEKRIINADTVAELPRCPISRCANMLTKSEIARVAEKVHPTNQAFSRVLARVPDQTDEERPPPKDEIRVYCSIYNSDANDRSLNLPKTCTVADMASAFMQMFVPDRIRPTGTINLFIRYLTESGEVRHDPINLKAQGKKPIRDIVSLNEKVHLVIDLNNEIK